jgi:xanthine dehydrogenase accessory factor
MNGTASPVWLFGAGHVGCATIQALLPLGFEITWIDGRSGQFP